MTKFEIINVLMCLYKIIVIFATETFVREEEWKSPPPFLALFK